MNTVGKNNDDLRAPKLVLKDVLKPYLRNWYWFIIVPLICLIIAFVYQRYTVPSYDASATIMIVDENNLSPDATLLAGLSGNSTNSTMVEGEIQVLKSRAIMQEVVERLNLQVQFFTKGRITKAEVYNDPPVKLNFLISDSILENIADKFNIHISSKTEYQYSVEDGTPKTYLFGETIQTRAGNLIVIPSGTQFDKFIGKTLEVVITPVRKVREKYKNRISVYPISKGSNILSIYLKDPVQEKAKDIVNTLVKVYNKNSVDEKNQVAKATATFIDDRIKLISADLSEVDVTKERFKVGNKLTDIQSEAGIFLETGAQNEQQLIQLGTQLNTVSYMSSYLEDQDNFELLPSNVGLSDQNVASVTSTYNELVLERQRLLKASGENNPVVVQLDQQLNGLKATMLQNLNNLESTLNIQSRNLQAREQLINARISAVPGQERQNRDIQRQQDIKEAIYLYLLQKREESAISMAATSPNSKVIEPAYSSFNPISSGTKVYFAALMLGLIIPFGVIYGKELFDTKIRTKEDVTSEVPSSRVLAQLPHVEHNSKMMIKDNDRSILAESFRILRTNIDYMRSSNGHGKGEVIFVTSSIPGEGKSFVAQNLASIYALSHKRVLLIGADIRKPGLNSFTRAKPGPGLSEYLNGDIEVEDLIQPVLSQKNLDLVHSGKIPPNPAELLMDSRLEILFETLKTQYDVIIVDTAPSLPVTDTLLIGKYADRVLYIVRANYSEKPLLDFIDELHQEKKLPNLFLVLNDVKYSNLGYGAKLGYGYAVEGTSKRSWLKRG
ncbi:capsular exopolysaccharide family protein [Galbibacter marinus]|uniref:non-specific protein-tyrosine kinase n=1 Tax=Galbibacter marinus TaxID=555500 RepID=K2PUR6_9FLAO|nr:polysaccharide biosynthesis tyrosine autokinase [Galbibacter marinus]EKF56405.1 capsular exopolysaccharide family protein [Galbibacter marinus]